MKYTIAVGNILTGIELFGLYDSGVEAMNNAASFVTKLDWVIINIGSQEVSGEFMTNYERANHGSKENQDIRVEHQIRQVVR